MKKSELKQGDIFTLRDGTVEVFVRLDNGNIYCNKTFPYTSYNQELTSSYAPEFDIIKVVRPEYVMFEREETKPLLILDGVEYSESTLRSLIKKATS